jgi:hypothetical protein
MKCILLKWKVSHFDNKNLYLLGKLHDLILRMIKTEQKPNIGISLFGGMQLVVS